MLDQMKQLYAMQKEARALQKELADIEIEAASRDGLVTVVVTGELKVEQVTIDPVLLSPEKKGALERALKETLREAMAKAQQIAADKSKEMMKAMKINLPGL